MQELIDEPGVNDGIKGLFNGQLVMFGYLNDL